MTLKSRNLADTVRYLCGLTATIAFNATLSLLLICAITSIATVGTCFCANARVANHSIGVTLESRGWLVTHQRFSRFYRAGTDDFPENGIYTCIADNDSPSLFNQTAPSKQAMLANKLPTTAVEFPFPGVSTRFTPGSPAEVDFVYMPPSRTVAIAHWFVLASFVFVFVGVRMLKRKLSVA